MINPLLYFKSAKVFDLLSSFYLANFEKANVDIKFAEKIINDTWNHKSFNYEELRIRIRNYFNIVKTHLAPNLKEINPLELIDLRNVKTFLDFGANKMTTLNFIGRHYSHIDKLIALDLIPQANKFNYPEKSIYHQIDKDFKNFYFENNSIDLINLQFVLHHLENDEMINSLLSKLNRVLTKSGRLILWEESYVSMPSFETIQLNNKIGIATNFELTSQFYKLNEKEKFEFILINDWIINTNNEHMQWTGEIKAWNEWIELLSKHNFKLSNFFNLGLRINGKLRQGVHLIGEFVLS